MSTKNKYSFELKLERAREHLDMFQSQLRLWEGGAVKHAIHGKTSPDHPYRIVQKLDRHTREYVAEFQLRRQLPPRLSILIGDCLFTLRSALDHIAYALLSKEFSGKPLPLKLRKDSAFPIFNDPSRYQLLREKMIGSLGQRAQTIIDSLQPCNCGPDDRITSLWTLSELTNIDKHRAFNLIYSSSVIGLNGISPEIPLPDDDDLRIESFDIRMGGPFKSQTESLRYRAVAGKNNIQVRVNFLIIPLVAFGEPPVEGGIVTDILAEIIECIDQDVFARLKPLL